MLLYICDTIHFVCHTHSSNKPVHQEKTSVELKVSNSLLRLLARFLNFRRSLGILAASLHCTSDSYKMVGPMIVLAASAGVGALVGVAAADRCSGWRPPLGGAGGAQGPNCSTCGGTGKVACPCAQWSDGDVGCRTCAGSGRTSCRSCRGSGTSRRATVRVAVRAQRTLVAVTKAK